MTQKQAWCLELALAEWAGWWNEVMFDEVEITSESIEGPDGWIVVGAIVDAADPSVRLPIRFHSRVRTARLRAILTGRWHWYTWASRGATA